MEESLQYRFPMAIEMHQQLEQSNLKSMLSVTLIDDAKYSLYIFLLIDSMKAWSCRVYLMLSTLKYL